MGKTPKGRLFQCLRRALKILEVLSNRRKPMGLTELSKTMDARGSLSVVRRLLS